MAAKEKYQLRLNLVLLGCNTILSLFDIAIAKENIFQSLSKDEHYNFSIGNLVDNSKSSSLKELNVQNKEDILLTLKILADKQYDFDQNIYLAEGNVKALINGGILRSNLLRYEKSTGIISAEGDVRFTKGEQYFRAEEFRFDLLKKKGIIKDVYGIIDIKNVLDDLKIQSNSEKKSIEGSLNKEDNRMKTFYYDGLEFDIGNIQLPLNKITRSHKSIGSINNWRFKSDLINIQENGWESNRIIFTNDPFDPNQISFEGIGVFAEEDYSGNLIITSSKTNLILENKNKIFLGKRIFGGEKKKNMFEFMFDGKDRDGLVVKRRIEETRVNNNLKLGFEPQFLINRAILGKTNSYGNDKSINFADLFGLKIKINGIYKDWKFDSSNDFSTLTSKRIFSGLRHKSSFRKYLKMPILDESTLKVFTTYRSRIWNGTIGETEIKSAYGVFLEKTKRFHNEDVENNFNVRFGTAKYNAEKLGNNEFISLWRSSLFASLDSEYPIWKLSKENPDQNKVLVLSPVAINPELLLRTNLTSTYFKYEDSSEQAFLKFSFGPEIRLGKLERKFLDYTKLSVMPAVKFKTGNSPFKFDNAIDLKTVDISFMQQIYGPLMVDIISNLNIDKSSENYGEYFDTQLGILWHKRAYEFGIYYHPNNDAGGIYFRINGFNFDDSVKAVF